MAYAVADRAGGSLGEDMDQDGVKWVLGAVAALLAWVIAQKDKAAKERLQDEREKAAAALQHEREQNASLTALRAEIKDSFLHLEKRVTVVGDALLDLREEFSGKLSAVQQQQQTLAMRVEEQGRRIDAVTELAERKRNQLNALVMALQAQKIITMVPGDQSMSIMAANTDPNPKKDTGP